MHSHLIIHFDGSCSPVNPGGVAVYGFEITTPEGTALHRKSAEVCRGPGASNNVAEWAAVTAAIRHLQQQGWLGKLEIRGDSKLVINQLNGSWKCHKEHLRPYLEESRRLLEGMDWEAIWIPRSKNKNADALSRGAP